MSQAEHKSLSERTKGIRALASIASYLIAAVISLYSFRSVLPDWLFFLLQIVLAAFGVAVVWVILSSSSKLRDLIFRGERRRRESRQREQQEILEDVEREKRQKRDDFRVFLVGVWSQVDSELWSSLETILRVGAGTESYQSPVYGALARADISLGRIYRTFDPSTVSEDLLKHYKGKLENLNLLASQVTRYSDQVKSSGSVFVSLVKDLNEAVWEIHTDMEKKSS